MSDIKPTIKIKYKDLAPGSPFIGAFNQVAGCAFGGRADQALLPINRRIIRAEQEFKELRDKAFKTYGKLDKKAGTYSIAGLSDEKYREFEALVDGYGEQEVDLRIEAPIKVRKRKVHHFSALAAALVSEVIEVEYDSADEGADLDKVEA